MTIDILSNRVAEFQAGTIVCFRMLIQVVPLKIFVFTINSPPANETNQEKMVSINSYNVFDSQRNTTFGCLVAMTGFGHSRWCDRQDGQQQTNCVQRAKGYRQERIGKQSRKEGVYNNITQFAAPIELQCAEIGSSQKRQFFSPVHGLVLRFVHSQSTIPGPPSCPSQLRRCCAVEDIYD